MEGVGRPTTQPRRMPMPRAVADGRTATHNLIHLDKFGDPFGQPDERRLNQSMVHGSPQHIVADCPPCSQNRSPISTFPSRRQTACGAAVDWNRSRSSQRKVPSSVCRRSAYSGNRTATETYARPAAGSSRARLRKCSVRKVNREVSVVTQVPPSPQPQ